LDQSQRSRHRSRLAVNPPLVCAARRPNKLFRVRRTDGTNRRPLNCTVGNRGIHRVDSCWFVTLGERSGIVARSCPQAPKPRRCSLATQGLGGPMYVRMRPSRPTLSFGDGYIYWNIRPRVSNQWATFTFPARHKKSNPPPRQALCQTGRHPFRTLPTRTVVRLANLSGASLAASPRTIQRSKRWIRGRHPVIIPRPVLWTSSGPAPSYTPGAGLFFACLALCRCRPAVATILDFAMG
jgi:hypothetical protein